MKKKLSLSVVFVLVGILLVGTALAATIHTDFFNRVFGSETQRAVIAVQNRYGLEPDGVVGPITWNAIITMYNEYR